MKNALKNGPWEDYSPAQSPISISTYGKIGDLIDEEITATTKAANVCNFISRFWTYSMKSLDKVRMNGTTIEVAHRLTIKGTNISLSLWKYGVTATDGMTWNAYEDEQWRLCVVHSRRISHQLEQKHKVQNFLLNHRISTFIIVVSCFFFSYL